MSKRSRSTGAARRIPAKSRKRILEDETNERCDWVHTAVTVIRQHLSEIRVSWRKVDTSIVGGGGGDADDDDDDGHNKVKDQLVVHGTCVERNIERALDELARAARRCDSLCDTILPLLHNVLNVHSPRTQAGVFLYGVAPGTIARVARSDENAHTRKRKRGRRKAQQNDGGDNVAAQK